MAVQSVCSNFKLFTLITIYFLTTKTYAEPYFGQPQMRRIYHAPFMMGHDKINQRYQLKSARSINFNDYYHNQPNYDENLYDKKQTSYDVPLFSPQHINNNKNYDISEYQQILNEINKKQKWQEINRNYVPVSTPDHENVIQTDVNDSSHVLDRNLWKVIHDVLLKEEIREEEERTKKNYGRPHLIYGPPPQNKGKIVGIKLERPVKSVLVKEGTYHG